LLVCWTNCPLFDPQKKRPQIILQAVARMLCTVIQSRVNDCFFSEKMSSENCHLNSALFLQLAACIKEVPPAPTMSKIDVDTNQFGEIA